MTAASPPPSATADSTPNTPIERRVAARALITRGDNILVLRKKGDRYALPGGGQTPGESLHQTLQRECYEEIGSRVQIGSLLCVADYLKQRESEPGSQRHLVETLFACEVPEDYRAQNGPAPDKSQLEVCWLPRQQLADVRLLPLFLPGVINEVLDQRSARRDYFPQYLGLIEEPA